MQTENKHWPKWRVIGFFTFGVAAYVYFVINPSLYVFYCEQCFFFDGHLIRPFLAYPGGPLALADVFLSQFYYLRWAGTLLIVCLVLNLILLTNNLFVRLFDTRNFYVYSFIPACLLLALHQSYGHPVATDVGLLLSIYFFNCTIRFHRRSWVGYAGFFLFLGGLLYYVAGGYFFLFGILCAIYEILVLRRWQTGISAFISLIVLVAFSSTLQRTWLFPLSLGTSYAWNLLPYGLLLFFSLVVFLSPLAKRLPVNTIIRHWIAGSLVAGSCVLIFFTQDRTIRNTLLIDQYAETGQWQRVVRQFEKYPTEDWVATFQMHRALYHEGRLLEGLFRYPQTGRIDGLLLPNRVAYKAPLQNSEFWLACGHLNEAQHWAHEALAIQGETGRVLQQLAVIYQRQHHFQAAEKCLCRLEQSLMFKRWARDQRRLMASNREKTVQEKGGLQVDFIVHPVYPENDLEHLVREQPENRMAFEYWMACQLLMGKHRDIKDSIRQFRLFGFSRLPKPIEEALILDEVMSGNRGMNLCGYSFDKKTVRDFYQMQKIVKQYQHDAETLKTKFRESFGQTYWYYALMVNPNNQAVRNVDAATQATHKM